VGKHLETPREVVKEKKRKTGRGAIARGSKIHRKNLQIQPEKRKKPQRKGGFHKPQQMKKKYVIQVERGKKGGGPENLTPATETGPLK